MFGYRRAALPKISCQCTGIRGTGPKAIQDRAPRGVSDSPKHVATGLSAMHATCNLLVTYHETQQSVKIFLAIPHDPTLKALEDQKFGDKDLNGFSVLINGDIAHANRRLVGLGSRRNDFDDLALNMQGVTSIGSMNSPSTAEASDSSPAATCPETPLERSAARSIGSLKHP